MIVYRWTWLIKHTRLEEMAAWANESCERWWKPKKVTVRIYASDVGPGSTLVAEMEARDEQHFAQIWKEYNETDANTAWAKDSWKKFNEATERLVSTERWNLVT